MELKLVNNVNTDNGTSRMLLEGKNAVIYGAAGNVGRIFSLAFAREGANVFLAGRTMEPLENLSKEILKFSDKVHVDKVDASSSQSVKQHLEKIITTAGKIEISLNLTSASVGMGKKLTEIPDEKMLNYSFDVFKCNFLTATASARQMQLQKTGVILGFTPEIARIPSPNMGGFGIGTAAMESFYKQLGLEIGPDNVRVVCLRTGATPDNPTLDAVYKQLAITRHTTRENVEKIDADKAAFKRLPLLKDVAKAAVILASDYANTITATAVNVNNGIVVE